MSETVGAIVIEGVTPCVDEGRHPIKRVAGDTLTVGATIFKEGHDRLAAVAKLRPVGADAWQEFPLDLVNPGLDLWQGPIALPEIGRFEYTIEAWTNRYESWREELGKKREAGQDVALELSEGRELVSEIAAKAAKVDRAAFADAFAAFDAASDQDERAAALLSNDLRTAVSRTPDRLDATARTPPLKVVVDRKAALFAAWYEFFPRSQGTVEGKGSTFADCERRLPEIREMGFNVVYLPPIHPIGRTHRKGPNNSLIAGPDDPGSPYAIGAAEGGHDAVHPELGTPADFRHFVEAAGKLGMEVALDFAIQCSPDHPWIEEHPEWFLFRPDGTIKYAENPPKKYQDIVNFNFHGPHREALWAALRDVILFWVDQGVKTFRVDNPHTKPVAFWVWLIGDVKARHPDVIFLAEAFTRPPMLKMLAKVGFSQSYTYFTWRNFKHELEDYGRELAESEVKEYLRPNFFANTPDILPSFLQTGGRPAFMIRHVLAATMSSVYGIYSGFELCENRAIPGTEEYAESEKYQFKVWDWDRPGHIKAFITQVNRIRNENPALHSVDALRFYPAHDDRILFYGKMTDDRSNMIYVVVNLDPFEAHEAELEFPLDLMGLEQDQSFEAIELIGDERHLWSGSSHRIRLDPQTNPAAIFRITPWEHIDFHSPYD